MHNEDKEKIKLTRRNFLQTVSAALAATSISSLAWVAAASDLDLVILSGRVSDKGYF